MNTASQTINIAIVDDHRLMRELLVEIIDKNHDFTIVMEFEDGEDFITALEMSHEHPDVCILDIGMKKMNGYVTLKNLKSRWPHIRVLILSWFYDDLAVIDMFANGANGYLKKGDTDLEEIMNAIRSVF